VAPNDRIEFVRFAHRTVPPLRVHAAAHDWSSALCILSINQLEEVIDYGGR